MREDLAFAGGLSGEVRLLANTNALTEFLPRGAGARSWPRHPHVSVDLEERLSDEIVGLIAEGVGDVGIVAARSMWAACKTYPFRSDRLRGGGGEGPSAGGPRRVVRSLRFLSTTSSAWSGSSLARSASSRARPPARSPLTGPRAARAVSTPSAGMVESGVGVGVVPQTTALRAAKTMALAVIDLADELGAAGAHHRGSGGRRAAALCAGAGGELARPGRPPRWRGRRRRGRPSAAGERL